MYSVVTRKAIHDGILAPNVWHAALRDCSPEVFARFMDAYASGLMDHTTQARCLFLKEEKHEDEGESINAF
jgi:hypothetical protein